MGDRGIGVREWACGLGGIIFGLLRCMGVNLGTIFCLSSRTG